MDDGLIGLRPDGTPYGPYQFPTGTGTLELLLYTGAGTKDRNLDVLGDINLDFEDPAAVPNTNPDFWTGDWGNGSLSIDGTPQKPGGLNGPVTVGKVRDYLHNFDPTLETPVFLLDLNQQGTDSNIAISAKVEIWDPDAMTAPVASWFLDATNNHAEGVTVDGQLVLDPQAVTFTGFTYQSPLNLENYTIRPDIGSGRPDFAAFAPTMILSAYDPDFLFVVTFHMGSTVYELNNGFEEIFLTGRYANPNPIPEPVSLLVWSLLGAASLATARFSRRRHTC